jgi:hypothetical protein
LVLELFHRRLGEGAVGLDGIGGPAESRH